LDEVIAGAEVTITRHGKPVAKLVPSQPPHNDRRQAAANIRALRDEIEQKYGTFEDFDWKAAVEWGRR
jgi:antitoxin (DNA-binding transcriptional repressor) of toxin-antitoxin stability system